ncbi:transglutaminase-like cysteine peptidase [Novosphingobium sp.]|uniref:transglutaminase-like cysteine peptidase n=1 Tax=Novosphingobium sp. TaxID=1874826 RepID=UPI0025E60375|nr:transglutaminase-like cysteine peptidase [Novosphingobium sp.]
MSLLAQPASASLGVATLPMAVAASAFAASQPCPVGIAPAAGFAEAPSVSLQSKSAAILGGAVSQLDLIRQQQAASLAQPNAALAMSGMLEPATGPSFSPLARPANCNAPGFIAAVRPVVPALQLGTAAAAPIVPLSPDNFLASKRLPIRRTSFDKDWARVSAKGFSGSAAARLVAVDHGVPGMAELTAVNSWANGRIRYVEDRVLYGKADYWATAGETIRRGAGDCEDIAIAKMQLLAALGVARGAMYLTIARDTVRAADHAVLVVKLDGKAWLLDNATDRVLDASASYDYRPIVSFSENKRWIHGY